MLITPGAKPVAFKFREAFRKDLLARTVGWNIPGLSEFTFIRTYARKKDNGKLETWNECVVRVIEGMFTILRTHAKYNMIPWDDKRGQKLAQEAAERMFAFKWLPPGRGLWMMGTPFIWEKGAACLQNCSFISTVKMGQSVEETVRPFTFMMDMSMLGVGVGFDTRGAENDILVRGYSDDTEVFVVEDTRESWVEFIGTVIRNSIYGDARIVPDVSKVRPAGLPIRGFGGVSSGPDPLLDCARGVAGVLAERKGQTLRSTDIVDVQNLIGKCVVAGNVRRSAQLALSPPDDSDFFQMKNWSTAAVQTGSRAPDELKLLDQADYDAYNANLWNTQNGVAKGIVEKYRDADWAWKFGGWRWSSNNSMAAVVGQDYRRYEASIKEAGEPGFAWLDTMRAYGRLKDPINNKDYRVVGTNPCVEQSLESSELCNLVETFPVYHNDYWDYQRSLKFAYLYSKTVTLMGTHDTQANAVMIRNRRIGCSMSGIADAIAKFGRTTFMREFADRGYEYICYVDKKYSEWLGVPESIKKTSIKPSGTVSLVAGVFGPGLHFAKMATGYRLIRVAAASELVPLLKNAGFRVEPSVTDPLRTVVVYFPWLTPEGIVTEDEATIWEKMKMAADLQFFWADNQTSATVEFTREEGDRGEIARVLEAFDGQLKGISFLPASDAKYAQMPFTRADRREVEDYASQLGALDFSSLTKEGDDNGATRFCDSEGCLV